MTDRVADILASHAGGSLSLKGLGNVSPSRLAKLWQNPGIELPHRLRLDPATPAATGLSPHPSQDEMIAVIERIAQAGEEALNIK